VTLDVVVSETLDLQRTKVFLRIIQRNFLRTSLFFHEGEAGMVSIIDGSHGFSQKRIDDAHQGFIGYCFRLRDVFMAVRKIEPCGKSAVGQIKRLKVNLYDKEPLSDESDVEGLAEALQTLAL
jgi:hypothetical protein